MRRQSLPEKESILSGILDVIPGLERKKVQREPGIYATVQIDALAEAVVDSTVILLLRDYYVVDGDSLSLNTADPG